MNQYKTYDDERLVLLLRQGDVDAFNTIYGKYWKRMFSVAMVRLKRRELAEDVVQEVFTALWFRAEHQQINHLESWLATAVKYKVITLAQRELRISLQQEPPDIGQNVHPSEFYFMNQAAQKAIGRLPERCQLIFKYHQLFLTNAEISKKLEISEKAVEKQLTKARQTLRLVFRQILSSFFI